MKKLLLKSMVFLLLLASHAYAQNRTITGTVTGTDDGSPIPGASITIRGTKVGTQTGVNGKFSISIPSGPQSIIVSFIGYASKVVPINGVIVNVALDPSQKSLNEVVITGYGTQVRRDYVGSSANIKGDAIAQAPVQSFEQALAGRAPGVQLTIPAGVLNTPPVIRVRGTNSISLSSQPLFVIDGQVAITGDVSLASSAGDALSNINPEDIENIEVAKDAAATAIYGSRAANGVIFVTTKKGKTGKAKVGMSAWVGFSNAYNQPKLLDAFQYTDYKNEAVANAVATRFNSAYASGTTVTHFALTNDANGNPINTNWYDVIYQQGVSQNYNLNVSGGAEGTTYYGSFGYTDEQGIVRKQQMIRASGLFNIDSKLNKYVSVGGKLSYSNTKNLAAAASGSLSAEAYGTAGLGRTAFVNAPNVSPYNNDGTLNLGATFIGPMNNVAAGNQIGFYNPVYEFNNNRENNETDHISSNAYFQFKPFNVLALKTVYGIDYINSDNDQFAGPLHAGGQGVTGEATDTYRKYKRYTWTNTAQFTKSFGKHSLDVLAGQEQQRNTTNGYGLDRQTLSDLSYTVIQAGFTTPNTAGLTTTENYLLSYFGRLNYNFDQKYYITGNIRQDEYSALGVKRGVFYGFGAGWELTKENFWEKAGLNKVFSSFRLTGSYGKVGNVAGIGDFSPYSVYGSGLYGGTSTLVYSSVGAPTLQWETSKKTDISLRYGLLNDRLSGEIAYYKNDVDGLILAVPQAPSAGLPNSPLKNAGSMYNKGLEFSIGGVPVKSKNFTWNSNFNISFNKNEVTALASGLTEIITPTGTTTTGENPNRTVVGYPIGYLWVVKTGGVDPATGRRIFYNAAGKAVTYQHITPFVSGTSGPTLPNWNYLDGSNGTTAVPAITQAADAVMYKNTNPKYVGGWDNSFKYKGFDLDLLLTYQFDFYVYYGSNAGLHDQRYWNNAVDVLQRWQNVGDQTNFVKPYLGDNVSYGNTIPLDINVFRGDFVRVKNLTLGYTLPRSMLNKINVNSVRVYASGQNLALFTKYPGSDPEVASNGTSSSGQGTERNSGPAARVITFGVNIGF